MERIDPKSFDSSLEQLRIAFKTLIELYYRKLMIKNFEIRALLFINFFLALFYFILTNKSRHMNSLSRNLFRSTLISPRSKDGTS